MTDKTLIEPTVKDVIRALSELPQDTPFRVLDPDTQWIIYAFRIGLQSDGTVWLRAHYGDMITESRHDLDCCDQITSPEDNERINDLYAAAATHTRDGDKVMNDNQHDGDAERLAGQTALLQALRLIGEPELTDHDLARIIVDNERELRYLANLRFPHAELRALKTEIESLQADAANDGARYRAMRAEIERLGTIIDAARDLLLRCPGSLIALNKDIEEIKKQ